MVIQFIFKWLKKDFILKEFFFFFGEYEHSFSHITAGDVGPLAKDTLDIWFICIQNQIYVVTREHSWILSVFPLVTASY